ncbi:unnamed protein product [Ectocarpus sp. 6 AP-2014]
MNDIAIDATTGDVAVKTMIKHIMPDLNENGILKSVHRVLEGTDGLKLSTRMINGRVMTVAPLGLCYDILEKMRGPRWRAWRSGSGQAFKKALRERVESVRSRDQAIQQDVQQLELAEQMSRASVLQNALRSINIHAVIRIDENSQRASIIDTTRVICPNVSPENAAHMLTRLLENEKGDGTPGPVPEVPLPTPISERIEYIKINGKGHITPVCNAQTLVEIIWLLPSSAAKEFRRQSAHTITRVLGGDLSLCDEVERRCDRLQSTEDGRAYQNFVLDQSPAKKQRSEAPFWFNFASGDQKRDYVSVMAKKAMAMEQMDLCKTLKDELQSVNQFTGRDSIEFADRMKDIQMRALAPSSMLAAGPMDADNSIVAVARPVNDSIDPETGLLIATAKCSESVRGPETSICNEAAKMGIKLGEKAGQVGKMAKSLYSKRHGVAAAASIPKRNTTYRGKPFRENTYWQRDADIVQEAIRTVCGLEDIPQEKTPQTLLDFFPSACQPERQTCEMEM